MSTYSLEYIQRWVAEGERLAKLLNQYLQEKDSAEQDKRIKEQELAAFIKQRITPLQKKIEIAKATKDVQQLPASIAQLQQQIETLSTSLALNQRQLRELSTTTQPLEQELYLLRSTESEKIRLQQQLRAAERELSVAQNNLLTAPLYTVAPYPIYRRPYYYGGYPYYNDWYPSSAYLAGANIINSIAYENTRQHYEAKIRDCQSFISRIQTTLSSVSYQNVEFNLGSVNERLSPHRATAAVLHATEQQLTADYHKQVHNYNEAKQQLAKAQRLLAEDPDSARPTESLAALEAKMIPLRDESIRQRSDIANKEHTIAAYTFNIQQTLARQEHRKEKSFLVDYTENPLSLFQQLRANIQAAVDTYETNEPYGQPIIVRQVLQLLKNHIIPDGNPQLRIQCAHGLIWQALDYITPENNNPHQKELGVQLRALLTHCIQKEEALAALQQYCPVTLPAGEDIIAEEKNRFEETLARFKEQLPLTATETRENRKKAYFHEKGYALAKAIEAKAKKEASAFDYHYYNSLLELSCRYLTNPQTTNMERFNQLIIKHSEGQGNLDKRLKGLSLMFLGAGLMLMSVPLMLMSSGLFSIMTAAGVALITMGAKLYWDNREQGILKPMQTFKSAANASSLFTLWAKPPKKETVPQDESKTLSFGV